MPIVELQDGRKLEFESTPTPEDVDFAVSQLDQSQPQEQNTFLSSEPAKISNLGFDTDLMLSLAVDDKARMEYLAQELPGKNVTMDPKKGIMVDGGAINPRGFDVGDIPRNAGYAFNMAGQVAGSLLGLAGGGSAGSIPGAVVGTIAGGTAGGTFGEGLRIATGKMLGLTSDEERVRDRLIEEAKLSFTGEVLGLGLAGGGKALAASPVGKSLGSMWGKTIAKLQKSKLPVKDILRFVGQIDEDATSHLQKRMVETGKGFSRIEDNLADPQKMIKITKNALYGSKGTNINDEILSNVNKRSGLELGQEKIVEGLKANSNEGYISLLKELGVVDGQTVTALKSIPAKEISNGTHFGDKAYLNIAKEVVGTLTERRRLLGEGLEKAIGAGSKAGGRGFDISDVGVFAAKRVRTEIDQILKVEGFEPKMLENVKGSKELKKFVNTLFGKRVKDADPFGKIVRDIPEEGLIEPLSLMKGKDLIKINNSLDAQADVIFRNQKIPGNIRNAVREIKAAFKESFYKQMDAIPEAKGFAQFAQLTDEIALGEGSIKSIGSALKSSGLGGGVQREQIIQALNGINTAKGRAMVSRLTKANAVNDLARKPSRKISDSLFKGLNKKDILSPRINNMAEGNLFRISQSLSNSSNKSMSSRAFGEQAKDFMAAQQFMNNGANILRVQAIAGMAGLSGLLKFGPLGGVGAFMAAQAITPKNIGKMLMGLEKASPVVKGKIADLSQRIIQKRSLGQKTTKEVSRIRELLRSITSEQNTNALLRSIISRTQAGSQN